MGIRVTMDSNDQAAEEKPPNTENQNPKSYNFLLRMSKKMGGVATRSFIEMRDFLHQEIKLTQSERFLAGMPKWKRQKNAESPSGQLGGEGSETNELDPSEKLETIIKRSHEVLAEANTVFPVTLFPDTVVVDRTKVTIIKRDFFWSSDTMTFRIEDVLNAEVTVGPIFGSLTIASRVMSTTDHFQIRHFWRKDAVYLKGIIQGYIIAQHNKIDVTHLPKDELIRTLDELGHHRSR